MAAVRGWRVIKMYKARGPGIIPAPEIPKGTCMHKTTLCKYSFSKQIFVEHRLQVEHCSSWWDNECSEQNRQKFLPLWSLCCGGMGVEHEGWGASRGPGWRAKGTVYVTPEADSAGFIVTWATSPAVSVAVSFGKTTLLSHLRLCIIIAISIEYALHARYCTLSCGGIITLILQ